MINASSELHNTSTLTTLQPLDTAVSSFQFQTQSLVTFHERILKNTSEIEERFEESDRNKSTSTKRKRLQLEFIKTLYRNLNKGTREHDGRTDVDKGPSDMAVRPSTTELVALFYKHRLQHTNATLHSHLVALLNAEKVLKNIPCELTLARISEQSPT